MAAAPDPRDYSSVRRSSTTPHRHHPSLDHEHPSSDGAKPRRYEPAEDIAEDPAEDDLPEANGQDVPAKPKFRSKVSASLKRIVEKRPRLKRAKPLDPNTSSEAIPIVDPLTIENDDEPESEDREASPRRRRLMKRRMRRSSARQPGQSVLGGFRIPPKYLIGGGVALLVFVWLLPTLIAHSPIFTWMLQRSTSKLNGTVTVHSASLGWFSPIVLSGVTVVDENKQPLADVPTVRGDRSLLSLLGGSQLGTFRLEQPKLVLIVRENGTNLEDALAEYLKPSDEKKTDLAIEIVDGTLAVQDAQTQRAWQIDKFQLSLTSPASAAKPIELTTSGSIGDARASGNFQATAKLQQTVDASNQEATPDELSLTTESLPLSAVEPILRRYVQDVSVAGRLTSTIQCRFDRQSPDGAALVQAKVLGESLRMSCAALGDDRPSIQRLEASGQVAYQAGRLRFDDVSVNSDFGTLTIAGLLDVANPATTRGLAALAQQKIELEGQLDLPRLAAALPGTLRIRQGTQITSGKLEMRIASRPENDGVLWQARLAASNLTAKNGAQQIHWDQPVQATLVARRDAAGVSLDRFDCQSDFFTAHANGSRNRFTATLNFDLNRLAQQSGGFVDLGRLRLAGEGWSRLNWTLAEDNRFDARLEFRADRFQLAVPGRLTWDEAHVAATLAATGRSDFADAHRIDTARLSVETGSDQFQLRLIEPVADFRPGRTWPLELYSQGQLKSWPARISPWVDLSGWKLGGEYQIVAEVAASRESVGLSEAQFTVDNLVVAGPSLDLREQRVDLVATGNWNWASRRLDLQTAHLLSSSVKGQADRFTVAFPPGRPMELLGAVQGQTNLARLQQWLSGPQQPAPAGQPAAKWWLQGELSARTEFQQAGGVISAKFDSAVNDLVITGATGQRYQEKQVRLAGRGSYNDLKQSIQIEQATLTSGTVGCNAFGRLGKTEGQTDLQLNGKIDYDLNRVSEILRAKYGQGIRIAGSGSSPMSYRGPISGAGATGTVGLNWEWADLYGFQVGPGELQASVGRGLIDVQPMVLAVNEGQVKLEPKIFLAADPQADRPHPMTLALPAGRTIDQVRITPAICASALQYIAPVLAGIAQAEGKFSIEFDACQVPLAHPVLSDISGKMIVHSVQIGPGHLIRELALLLGRAEPARLTKESAIPFRLVNGRVYHKDLELAFSNVTVRSYGSVGLDESLAVMIEMPVPTIWQTNPLLAAALRNQTISVPVGGTLKQPRIDRQALDQLARQFVQNAATSVVQDQARTIETQVNREIENRLNRAVDSGLNRLDRLLNPQQPAPKQ